MPVQLCDLPHQGVGLLPQVSEGALYFLIDMSSFLLRETLFRFG